jgi:hypothetical protein
VLVVANLAAFQLRYGHGADATIAGLYAGNLSNGGERLRLIDALGLTIRDFTFSDLPPWPIGPDGNGPSLVLIDPTANPDHADPAKWTSSAIPGGLPMGVSPVQKYAAWRALYWSPTAASNDALSGPAADFDGDRLANFLEYAFGLDPRQLSPTPMPIGRIEIIDGDPHLTLSLRVAAGAANATRTWEMSDNLVDWTNSAAALQLLSSQLDVDGTTLLKYFETNSAASSPASARASKSGRGYGLQKIVGAESASIRLEDGICKSGHDNGWNPLGPHGDQLKTVVLMEPNIDDEKVGLLVRESQQTVVESRRRDAEDARERVGRTRRNEIPFAQHSELRLVEGDADSDCVERAQSPRSE